MSVRVRETGAAVKVRASGNIKATAGGKGACKRGARVKGKGAMAKAKKGKKPEFPFRKSDEKALEEGQRVARAQYYTTLRGQAKDILEDAAKIDVDQDEYIEERIRDQADSAVTYTRNALDIMMQSDNWTAIEDVGGDISASDITGAVTQIAYYAYEQDLRELVDAHRDEYLNVDDEDEDREDNPPRRKKRRTKKRSSRRKRRR